MNQSSDYKHVSLDPLHHALNLVGEEASEVAQQVSKIMRFGLLDAPPSRNAANLDILQSEVTDLMANLRILNLELVRSGLQPLVLDDEEKIYRKMQKVELYAERSIALGTLTAPMAFMPGPLE